MNKYYLKYKEKILKRSRIWRQLHPDYSKNRHQNLRLLALEIVGKGKLECANCGCKDIRILEINHLNGGGHKERGDSYTWYNKIIKNKRKTDDLNILCKVCNVVYFLKLKYGIDFLSSARHRVY